MDNISRISGFYPPPTSVPLTRSPRVEKGGQTPAFSSEQVSAAARLELPDQSAGRVAALQTGYASMAKQDLQNHFSQLGMRLRHELGLASAYSLDKIIAATYLTEPNMPRGPVLEVRFEDCPAKSYLMPQAETVMRSLEEYKATAAGLVPPPPPSDVMEQTPLDILATVAMEQRPLEDTGKADGTTRSNVPPRPPTSSTFDIIMARTGTPTASPSNTTASDSTSANPSKKRKVDPFSELAGRIRDADNLRKSKSNSISSANLRCDDLAELGRQLGAKMRKMKNSLQEHPNLADSLRKIYAAATVASDPIKYSQGSGSHTYRIYEYDVPVPQTTGGPSITKIWIATSRETATPLDTNPLDIRVYKPTSDAQRTTLIKEMRKSADTAATKRHKIAHTSVWSLTTPSTGAGADSTHATTQPQRTSTASMPTTPYGVPHGVQAPNSTSLLTKCDDEHFRKLVATLSASSTHASAANLARRAGIIRLGEALGAKKTSRKDALVSSMTNCVRVILGRLNPDNATPIEGTALHQSCRFEEYTIQRESVAEKIWVATRNDNDAPSDMHVVTALSDAERTVVKKRMSDSVSKIKENS